MLFLHVLISLGWFKDYLVQTEKHLPFKPAMFIFPKSTCAYMEFLGAPGRMCLYYSSIKEGRQRWM